MEILAHARIVMWEGGALWVVDATAPALRARQSTDQHAHHAIQVTLSLGGRFRLESPDGHVDGDAVAVAPDAPHTFQAEGLIALLFIAPESRTGRAVAAQLFQGKALAAVPDALLGEFRAAIAAAFTAARRSDDAAFIALGQGLAAHMAAEARSDVPDLRVRKAIAWMTQSLDGQPSLGDAAAAVNLSPGRLRHLFVEHTGLPFKAYLLWLRLSRALQGFAGGMPLTQAAHEAGFSDSAHLSRTFRRMFGIAPAGLRMT